MELKYSVNKPLYNYHFVLGSILEWSTKLLLRVQHYLPDNAGLGILTWCQLRRIKKFWGSHLYGGKNIRWKFLLLQKIVSDVLHLKLIHSVSFALFFLILKRSEESETFLKSIFEAVCLWINKACYQTFFRKKRVFSLKLKLKSKNDFFERKGVF